MKRWFVLQVSAGREGQAADQLRRRGLDVYLPEAVRVTYHRRKKRLVNRPFVLFTGYLFVCEPASWPLVCEAPDVIRPVCVGGSDPAALPSGSIEALQACIASGVFNKYAIRKGELVRVDFLGSEIVALVNRVAGLLVHATAEFMGRGVQVTRHLSECRPVVV